MTTLYIVPGDDFVYTATVLDDDGDAYNLTGATLWFTVKRRKSDADTSAIAQLYWISGGASSGITVATPATGIAAIRIAAADTDEITQAAHSWDLQLKDAAGVVRTVDHGTLVVLNRATAKVVAP